MEFHFLQNGWIYSRWINPTTDAASQALNHLEGGQGTLLFASGMAAISTALFTVLKSGDHMVSASAFCYSFSCYYNMVSAHDYQIRTFSSQ